MFANVFQHIFLEKSPPTHITTTPYQLIFKISEPMDNFFKYEIMQGEREVLPRP